MRWKVLFAMILRHDDFCMSPRSFDGIGTCTSFRILEIDRMINLQVLIALVTQTAVRIPTIGDDSYSWEDPVLDDRNQCSCISKILTTQHQLNTLELLIRTNLSLFKIKQTFSQLESSQYDRFLVQIFQTPIDLRLGGLCNTFCARIWTHQFPLQLRSHRTFAC